MTPRELEEEFLADISFERVHDNARMPKPARNGDSSVDLCSLEYAKILPLHRLKVRTGIKVDIPSPFVGLIVPRPGLVVKHGLTILNSPGIIDSNYTDEIMVVLHNSDPKETFKLVAGARIAQLLIVETPEQRWFENAAGDTQSL